ncbi:MAG: cytochrome c3 family protein [Candidatus Tectimicrobiota bacterium]
MRWHSAVWLAVVLVVLGHGTAPGAEGLPNSTCLGCHTPALDEMPAEVRANMVETGAPETPQPAEELLRRKGSLAVDEKTFQASVHGSLPCTACHQDIDQVPHRQRLKRVACETCHADAGTAYRKSAHARAMAGGIIEAASCQDCHGSHDIRPVKDRASRVYPANLPATCASCHARPDFPRRRAMRYPRPFEAYSKSIHFKALKERGLIVAATCTSCHLELSLVLPLSLEGSRIRLN